MGVFDHEIPVSLASNTPPLPRVKKFDEHHTTFFSKLEIRMQRHTNVRRECRLWLSAAIGLFLLVVVFQFWLIPPSSPVPIRRNVLIGPLHRTASQSGVTWITISEGLITGTSRGRDRLPPNSEADLRMGAGLFAVPGLIDSHVHLPPRVLPGQLDFLFLMFLSHGVTSVRELGSLYLDVPDLQSSISDGERVGPRVFGCGIPLTGSSSGIAFLEPIENEGELKRAIEERARVGLRCIKIYRGFPASLLPRAADLARQLGLDLVGHLPRDTPWDATELNDIQHVCDPRCAELRPFGIDALVKAAREAGVRHTPTLVTFDNPLKELTNARPSRLEGRVPRTWLDLFWNPSSLAAVGVPGFLDSRAMTTESDLTQTAVRHLIHAGATIQVGTDTPFPFVIPGEGVYQEMRLLEEMGYSVDEVWAAATSVPGAFLSGENLGQIVPGAPADILLFRDDPTRDLDALSTLEYVIASGRVYDVDDLRARVSEQLRYLNGPVYEFAIDPALRFAIDRLAKRSLHSDRVVH